MKRKGVLTAVIAFLIASMLVSGLGIQMAIGTAKDAFSSIKSQSDMDWVKQVLKANIKAVCKSDGMQNLPRHGTFTKSMKGLERIKIEEKSHGWSPSDKRIVMYLDYGSNSKSIELDRRGHLNSYACQDKANAYEINATSTGENGVRNWVPVDGSEPINFRIMEEEPPGGDDHDVNLQVTQD